MAPPAWAPANRDIDNHTILPSLKRATADLSRQHRPLLPALS
jgi:hypothetical protein